MFLPYGDDVQRRVFPVIPLILIAINVAVLIHTEILISSDDMQFSATTHFFGEFGLHYQQLESGRLSSLVTYMFLHDGILHLLGNMIILWAIGRSLCVALGRAKFLMLYCACGIIGGLTHLCISRADALPLVGASGAVAGLIGAYAVAFGPFSKVKCVALLGFIPLHFRIPAMLFGLIWFALQVVEASVNPAGLQDVSWFAHIGGFSLGALVMFLARHHVREQVFNLIQVSSVRPAPPLPQVNATVQS